jgi:hypothetical protein
METASLWRPVAEAAHQLLSAGWVQITHFEETEPLITVKGVSYFVPPELNRLLTVTQTLVSPLDPFHRAHQPTVNRVMRQQYLEAQTVCAPLEDFLCDIWSPELCQSLASYANLRLVCAVPLWYQGKVSGALIAYGISEPNGPALQLLAQLASLVWLQEQAQGNTHGELEDCKESL